MRKVIAAVWVLALLPAVCWSDEPGSAETRSRIQAIAAGLPQRKAQLDALRARGQDVAYPLVTYTVLERFTGYALDDLNTSVPTAWGFRAINGCNTRFEPARDAHGGQWAAKIITHSTRQPNIYGMLENQAAVGLTAGKTYTLSVWVKTDDPGIASMPVDAAWNNRLMLASTQGRWQRFAKTFTPGPGDLAFNARVLSETSTPGLLVDDVCLVEGTVPETGKNLIPNGSFETSWSAQRVGRELPDMETMAHRIEQQLADAASGKTTLPTVPRWNGTTRPKIQGPSFVAGGRPWFFVGYGHFQQVRSDVEKFPDFGINIVQHAEFGPSGVFTKEDVADDTAVKQLIDELDRAAKAGVAVDFLISPHYFPQWFFDKYPKLRVPRGDFFPWSIYAPQGRELVKKFIDHVIPRIKDKPALLSICLSNEPINVQDPDEYSIGAWHAWLKQRHGDVATLNGRWKTHYAAVDDIPQPKPNAPGEPRSGPAWCDFVRWNQEYFADFHKQMADWVHAIAPDLPVHVKATTWNLYRADLVKGGDDPTLLSTATDINGNDSVNLWSFGQRSGNSIERGDKDFAQGWRENALAYELQRSVHDAPVFNSENHLIADRDDRYVDPAHVRAALWMGAIHGQSATTIWLWEREKFNPASDLAGDIIERASCAQAVGIVCHDLNRVAPQITAIQTAPPDVLILQSGTSAVWDGGMYDAAMLKMFTALSFTGLKIGFVTEYQLERRTLADARILFVPASIHLSDAAYHGLEAMRGQLVFANDDNLLSRNEYDQPRTQRLAATKLPLGANWQETLKNILPLLDRAAIQSPVKVQTDGGDWGAQWQTANTSEGLLVNLYNPRHDPIRVVVGGRASLDLLTGQKIAAGQRIELAPMEFRLIRVDLAK